MQGRLLATDEDQAFVADATLCPVLFVNCLGQSLGLCSLNKCGVLRCCPQIEYSPGGELAGATPAFVPAVLTFVEVMRRWQESGITVHALHEHVVSPSCRPSPSSAGSHRRADVSDFQDVCIILRSERHMLCDRSLRKSQVIGLTLLRWRLREPHFQAA